MPLQEENLAVRTELEMLKPSAPVYVMGKWSRVILQRNEKEWSQPRHYKKIFHKLKQHEITIIETEEEESI